MSRTFLSASCRILLICAIALSGAISCVRTPESKQYELQGQILQVNRNEGIVTIRHGDIKGFMPAMTMPFKVKDKRLLDGRGRGDLVKGTLLVTDTDAYLTGLDVVGHASVAEARRQEAIPIPILETGMAVPDVRLFDARGRPFMFSSLRGSLVLLTFIYTRCPFPNFCPLMDRQFAVVLRRVRDDARLRASVRMLSISFDPEYDTPAVLDAHSRGVGADGTIWRFATADRQTIDAFAPRFGTVVVREADSSFTHNLRTAIVNRDGRLLKIYNGSDWTPDDVVADLVKAAGT